VVNLRAFDKLMAVSVCLMTHLDVAVEIVLFLYVLVTEVYGEPHEVREDVEMVDMAVFLQAYDAEVHIDLWVVYVSRRAGVDGHLCNEDVHLWKVVLFHLSYHQI